MTTYYNKSTEEIYKTLKTGPDGLTEKIALHRLTKYGPNKLQEPKPASIALIFLSQFRSPLIYILLIAALTVFCMGEYMDGIIILFVLFFNSLIGTFQENKAQKTFLSLKKYAGLETTVVRAGRDIIISDSELVVGDIIKIQEGEKVAADARIITANNLKTDESILTGESNPIEKNPEKINIQNLNLAERSNIIFKSTTIVSGNGKAIVFATGQATEVGKISESLLKLDKNLPLKETLDRLSKTVIIIVLSVNFLILFLGLTQGKNLKEMIATVISMSVSAIPEGLPIVLTLILAIGVARMGKKNVLVKKLQAVEALGQVNIIAVDKTGTLTKNEMMVEKIWTNNNLFVVTGSGYEAKGDFFLNHKKIKPEIYPELMLAGEIATHCNSAWSNYIENEKRWKAYGDPTEVALNVFRKKLGFKRNFVKNKYELIEEIPFNYEKKYRAVIAKEKNNYHTFLIGAPEKVLAISKLTKKEKTELEEKFNELSSSGLRVLAFAYKKDGPVNLEKDFKDLNFGGYFGIKDALREEVKEMVRKTQAAGAKVIMITGDHRITAEAIGREAGIFTDGDLILTENDLEGIAEDELFYKISKAKIFARITPDHKLKIIEALKKKGFVVAMTGDGVNDSPSLAAANVGVAMGRIGTEVAKDASDIILLDDNFGNIVSALKEGRLIYQNMKKVILYLFSTNLGEIFTIIFSVLFNLPLPLLPAQIIWLNLISDSFMDVGIAMEPKEKDEIEKNQNENKKFLITKIMGLRMVIMSTIMTLGTLAMFVYYLKNPILSHKASTITLTTLAVFHWFNAWNCRSEKKSILSFSFSSNKYLLGALLIVVGLQMLAIYTPLLNKILNTTPLSFLDWALIIFVSFSIIITEEVRKFLVRKKAL